MTNPLLKFLTAPLELQLPSGKRVSIQTCYASFELWHGTPIEGTYGGKAVLDCRGEPLFAELRILRLLQDTGWEGAWIDTYRKRFLQFMPPHSCDLPSHAQAFLHRANAGRKWSAGCPDVLAWSEGRYLFIEAKRKGQDRIGNAQKAWVESALNCGVSLESLVIFEWEV
jgi:hypothetical protein